MLGPLLKRSQHIQVDFITSLISKKSKKILNFIVNFVVLISSCVFLKAGYDATLLYFNLGQMLEIEMSVPIWWMFLAFPVGFFILGLVAIELLVENIKEFSKVD